MILGDSIINCNAISVFWDMGNSNRGIKFRFMLVFLFSLFTFRDCQLLAYIIVEHTHVLYTASELVFPSFSLATTASVIFFFFMIRIRAPDFGGSVKCVQKIYCGHL
jgi:hypothetical protein